MNNADLPAMPIGEQIDGIHMNPSCNGMTKREYIATQILAGWASNVTDGNRPQHYQYAAESSVKLADALLKALEESK